MAGGGAGWFRRWVVDGQKDGSGVNGSCVDDDDDADGQEEWVVVMDFDGFDGFDGGQGQGGRVDERLRAFLYGVMRVDVKMQRLLLWVRIFNNFHE